MPQPIILSNIESDALALLGQRLRHARLRRNLSQADMAADAGMTRKTLQALESGSPGVGLGCLVKALAALGYPDRISSVMAGDPVADDMEAGTGRQRASSPKRTRAGGAYNWGN